MKIIVHATLIALSLAAPLAFRNTGPVVLAPGDPTLAAPASCEGLASLALPHVKIDAVQVVAQGAFVAPGPGRSGAPNPYAKTPAFCRVSATLTPSSDSNIKAEVWLPASGWNGTYQAVGGGGWAGVISYPAMAAAVAAGYATASTDTGHTGGTADFALGHPEKVIDFGYRAIHETTVLAKPAIDAFYGSAPKVSYFNGCSTGGRQAITEAQRYPNDFDAIVAGASAWDGMRMHSVRVAISQIVHAFYAEHLNPLGSCPDPRLIAALTPKKTENPNKPSVSLADYHVPDQLPEDLRSRLASFEDLCLKDWPPAVAA